VSLLVCLFDCLYIYIYICILSLSLFLSRNVCILSFAHPFTPSLSHCLSWSAHVAVSCVYRCRFYGVKQLFKMYKFIKKRKYPYFLMTYEEIHTEPVRVLRRLEKNLRLPPLGEVWLRRYVSMLRVYSASRASPVVGGFIKGLLLPWFYCSVCMCCASCVVCCGIPDTLRRIYTV
jgi:hypothetical protein